MEILDVVGLSMVIVFNFVGLKGSVLLFLRSMRFWCVVLRVSWLWVGVLLVEGGIV